MAAVLNEVEKLEPREEVDTRTTCGESGVTALKFGAGKESKADERERIAESYSHTRYM